MGMLVSILTGNYLYQTPNSNSVCCAQSMVVSKQHYNVIETLPMSTKYIDRKEASAVTWWQSFRIGLGLQQASRHVEFISLWPLGQLVATSQLVSAAPVFESHF